MGKGLISAIALAKTGTLFAPSTFKTTPIGELSEVCNGCGSASAKIDYVPDSIWGTSISEACHIHDWMYHVGSVIEDKDEADRVFENNLIRLIDKRSKWYKPIFLMKTRATFYVWVVEKWGGPAFWDGKPGN